MTGYKLCKPGDVVINSLWAWHRGIGVAQHSGIVSTAYSVLRLQKQNEWNNKFLDYLLRTSCYTGEYLIRSKGIWESRLQLTASNFLDVPILIPPLKTQNAIVAYLDKKTTQIQDFIRKKERLIDEIKERKYRTIEKYVTKGLVENCEFIQSDDILFGEVPLHWKIKRLRFVAKQVKTGTTPQVNKKTTLKRVILIGLPLGILMKI